jgi:diguanylate cyclase (GGDEF)-like protein/PAS domain S-box-containing protein
MRKISTRDQSEEISVPAHSFVNSKYTLIICLTVIVFMISGLYLLFEWNRYQKMASSEAIQLANSLEALMPGKHISELSGMADDMESPEFTIIRNNLARLVETTGSIRFAYLLGERDGSMIFLLDAESPDSDEYSPPGQIYTEADDIDWEPFKTGTTVLTDPRTDRWGTWISALVPIKDPTDGRVIAVFGIDYSASEWYSNLWKHMIPDLGIVICFLILYMAVLRLWTQRSNFKNISKKLEIETISKMSETNRLIAECMIKPFADVQEQLDFALHEAIKLTESQYGYIYFYDESLKEFTINSWTKEVMPDCDITEKQTMYRLEMTGIWGEAVRQRKPVIVNDFEAPNPLKKGYPEGHVQIRKFMTIPIFDNDHIVAVVGFANKEADYTDNDIEVMTVLMSGVWIATEKREKEKETELLLERLQSMINNHEAVMLLIEPLSGKIEEANRAAIRFYGYSKDELLSMTIQDINMLSKDEISELRVKALNKGHKYFTFPHRLKSGETRIVDVYSSPIEYNAKKVLFSIIFDVTKREEITKQNEYLAYHDHLTGVYNRRYFDEEFARRNCADEYPLAIIIGDVNGLKFYNDTYGHLAGDKVLKNIAQRIQMHLHSGDVLARISGDEFAIILSKTSDENVRKYMDDLTRKLNYGFKNDEEIPLTISFGYGIQRQKEASLDAIFKEAETYMNNRKYFDSKSTRSKTINIIMETLFAKSEREKKHSERVSAHSEAIAKQMKLDEHLIDRIRVAGLFHDIGKIGIDESILNKNGKHEKSEWEEMKLHSVKGADILERTADYIDIAHVVLSHHECYDGSGYPNGLKGEAIPLEARIIAVADSFDAMTNARPYQKAINIEDALLELKKCSGTQFDPQIVDLFIRILTDGDVPQLSTFY